MMRNSLEVDLVPPPFRDITHLGHEVCLRAEPECFWRRNETSKAKGVVHWKTPPLYVLGSKLHIVDIMGMVIPPLIGNPYV